MFRNIVMIGMMALLCLGSGCSCQVVGLHVPGQSDGLDAGGQKQDPPKTPPIVDITNSPDKYAVQGVATLTFYPKEPTAKEGSFGGYVLIYDKPQETNVQFASLKNNECQFTEVKRSNVQEKATFRGLNAGASIHIALPGHAWTWPLTPFRWGGEDIGVYYLGASAEHMIYPYERKVTLESKGGPDVAHFKHEWKAPSHLTVLKPSLTFTGPIRFSTSKALPLQWKFAGEAPYLAVRLNQSDPDGKTVRSLTCRYAPDGTGSIPLSYLSKFNSDDTGDNTHLFFFAGRYLLAQLPKFEKPLFVVMEAISSSSVILE